MSNVAELGIAVKETGTENASNKLTALTGAAARAEAATSGLSEANRGATGAAAAAARAYSQHGSAAATSSKQIEMMNRAANQNSAALGIFSTQMRMASMQLSQVAQQVQAGTGFLQALAIQLPDLALGFGPIGIAAGVAAGLVLTYFGNILSAAPGANMSLAEQSKLIRTVADDWGDATPQLRAYADELERLAKARDLLAAGNTAAAAQFTPIVDILASINKEYTAAVRNLRGYGEDTAGVVQSLTNTFATLQSKIVEGKANTVDLKAAQDAMATAVDQFGTPSVLRFAAAFGALTPQIEAAIKAAEGFRREGVGTILPELGSLSEIFGEGGKFYTPEDFIPETIPTPERRPLIELEGLPKVKGGGASNDNYKSSLLSIQERTKAIQAETAAQASLNPLINDYGFAVTKARASTELLAAAEKAKKNLTPELIAQIDKTSTALAQATAEQARQVEAVNRYRATVEFLKSTTAGFINDLRNGLRNGEGFWKSMGDAVMGVLDRITDKLLNDVLDAVFKVSSAGSGGGGGGIFGFLGSLFGGGGAGAFPSKPGIGLYAAGTPAARPGVAWVGEKGPELVRFKGGEEVIPNHRIMTAANQNGGAGQGSSSTVTAPVSISIDATGADPEGLARVQRELAALKADLPTRVVQTVKDAQKRRVI
ncbi:hypothetical protein [Neorhizobium tomejilense]|uniref:hypothetical protein n=1 Tax=Neorhizobium tomejilense TaxID=2093828 RepID=UPI000CF8432F|nr:hypothetical protein [Neorhizobium tomejilense]